METKILRLITIFLFLLPLCVVIVGTGCGQDDETLWEISTESESFVIQNKVDDIEFKFCLLNEAGEPATIFNEGENFTFYFSVTNNRNERFFFIPEFAQSNENDFFKVYSYDKRDLGKPYVFTGAVELIGIAGYLIEPGATHVFEQVWVDNREFWHWHYGIYESANKVHLAKGNYYTGFKYRFKFTRPDDNSNFYINTLSFKINFKIR